MLSLQHLLKRQHLFCPAPRFHGVSWLVDYGGHHSFYMLYALGNRLGISINDKYAAA
jgi:hypothetical protein